MKNWKSAEYRRFKKNKKYIFSRHFQFIPLGSWGTTSISYWYFKSCIERKMYLQLNPNTIGGHGARSSPCGVDFLQNLKTTSTESRVSSEKGKSVFENSHLLQKKISPNKFRIFSHFVRSRKMKKFRFNLFREINTKFLENRKCKNFAKKCEKLWEDFFQKNNAKVSQKNRKLCENAKIIWKFR